ncbi:hypothetical protein R3P38DRAFT_1768730, partial [Favolaschia claudopus]
PSNAAHTKETGSQRDQCKRRAKEPQTRREEDGRQDKRRRARRREGNGCAAPPTAPCHMPRRRDRRRSWTRHDHRAIHHPTTKAPHSYTKSGVPSYHTDAARPRRERGNRRRRGTRSRSNETRPKTTQERPLPNPIPNSPSPTFCTYRIQNRERAPDDVAEVAGPAAIVKGGGGRGRGWEERRGRRRVRVKKKEKKRSRGGEVEGGGTGGGRRRASDIVVDIPPHRGDSDLTTPPAPPRCEVYRPKRDDEEQE